MGKRGRANRRDKKRQEKKVLVIYVDGKTERWYFNLVKKQLANEGISLNLKPEIAKKGTPKEKLKELNGFIEKYQTELEQAYLLFDFDTIRGKNDWCQEIFNIRNKKGKKINGDSLNKKIVILINNPCFEYWFLLHFEKAEKYFKDCNSVIKILTKKVKEKLIFKEGYKKKEKIFHSFLRKLYGGKPFDFKLIEQPIKKAEKIGFINGLEEIDKSVAEIFVIFKHIDELRR